MAAIDDLRHQLETAGLELVDLDADPLRAVQRWYDEAVAAGVHQPDAMALATASPAGRPSVRHVLLKGIDDGLVFFTNYRSHKGEDLAANPVAEAVFPWLQLNRQARVAGPVERVSAGESDSYFASRPRSSQLGAWASEQSRPVASRGVLEERVAEADERYADGPVPRPPHWGGFRLRPVEVELWQGRAFRLHDRFRYRRDGDGWAIERLAP